MTRLQPRALPAAASPANQNSPMDRHMTTLPAPFVPGHVDLEGFDYMPLDFRRLRKSKGWLRAKRRPEIGFYMVNVWTGAWQNVPAGSVEDDDDVLADLAMCDPARWAEVKDDVMHGWVKCSDGRLYHPVVAEKVIEAWKTRVDHRVKMMKTRIGKVRKQLAGEADPNQRQKLQRQIDEQEELIRLMTEPVDSSPGTTKVADGGASGTAAPVAEQPATIAAPATTPVPAPVTASVTAPVSPVLPPDTGLKVEGKKESPQSPPLPVKRASPEAQAVVAAFLGLKNQRWPEDEERVQTRMTLETQAQQHLDAGGTRELLTEVIEEGIRTWKRPTPPRGLAAFKDSLTDRIAEFRRVQAGGGSAPGSAAADSRPFDPHEQARTRLRLWARGGQWWSSWGALPGERGCQIPPAVVLEEIPEFKPGWRPPAGAAKPDPEAA